MKTEISIPKIKSPLRYPGGKSRALKQILPILPDFKEFREPMVGGGSVFFALKQLFPNKKFWINDCNRELSSFWKICKNDVDSLIKESKKIKLNEKNGKRLHISLVENSNSSDFDKALRFFILNRITFSGLAESGGYSEQAFHSRFTDSSIDRLRDASGILQETIITQKDYEEVINVQGDNVLIFLDPPYLSKTKSKLYGKNGELHENFDHERFAKVMKNCKHKWLITYDDIPEVRKFFQFAYIYEWELQYGMNNYKQGKAAKGKELFISNYRIPLLEKKKETEELREATPILVNNTEDTLSDPIHLSL